MKILFIRRHMDRAELHLVRAIHRRGIYIRALTESYSRFREELDEEGLFIEACPYSSKLAPRFIRQIRSLIKEHGFTIIHAPDGKSLANAIWASYFLPVRIVAYRGTPARIRRTDPSYWIGILSPKVDRVICVSRSIYEYMHQFYPPEKLLLNYKGYDPEWDEHPQSVEPDFLRLVSGRFVVMLIAVAASRPHKGLKQLIQAVPLINIPNLLVVHIGTHDGDVVEYANKVAGPDRFVTLGARTHASRYLSYADIFVLPSLHEGFPRVVKEAMARGVPVVSSNIPGPTELVYDNETGLLVESGSPQAIAHAILRLHDDPGLARRLGQNGKAFLEREFSPDVFVEKTVKLYQSLAESK